MCRRCHEVFYLDESGERTTAYDPSARAEALLEEIHESVEKKEPEPSTDEYLANLTMAEEAGRRLEEMQQKISEAAPLSEESEISASQQFEDLYNARTRAREVKTQSYSKPSQYSSYSQAQPVQKQKSKKAAVVWIVVVIVFWIIMMIVCQVAEC